MQKQLLEKKTIEAIEFFLFLTNSVHFSYKDYQLLEPALTPWE
jgi:hypothetical protein